jgi:GMP synthase (glutamine-hydrolysing)
MSHGDAVEDIPEGFECLAFTDECKNAAIASKSSSIMGIQFHPEVSHTTCGTQIFKNFIKICNISQKSWQMSQEIEKIVKDLRETIKEPIIMAVSGGVDSTVAATLIEQAVPDLLHCVFVNNGVLRLNEAEEVSEIYKKLFKHFEYIDASEDFLGKLKGVTDPEQKRKIIGRTFIEIFEQFSESLKKKGIQAKFLGQGTIYPDRIESSQPSGNSQVIKSHHNVGGLPEKMNLKLVEPLKEFYKDEVREIGELLGISPSLVHRQPFPGPGLAIRCLGEVTLPRLTSLRKADKIFLEELQKEAKTWKESFQSFAVLLPVKTVGVMGNLYSCVLTF